MASFDNYIMPWTLPNTSFPRNVNLKFRPIHLNVCPLYNAPKIVYYFTN